MSADEIDHALRRIEAGHARMENHQKILDAFAEARQIEARGMLGS